MDDNTAYVYRQPNPYDAHWHLSAININTSNGYSRQPDTARPIQLRGLAIAIFNNDGLNRGMGA